MRVTQVVAGVVRHDDRVLLVQQQGSTDPVPNWALPGGRLEAGETFTEALRRELHEETGLTTLAVGELLFVSQIIDADTQNQTTTLVFEVAQWQGELRHEDDPDGVIKEVRFVPVKDAINLLALLPWRVMWEPTVTYLRGEVGKGAVWVYRARHGAQQLVELV